EKTDFREDAPKKYFRLAPGKEVRLKHAYYITCNAVIRDKSGEIVEIHCTHDPDSRGGWTDDGRKVRGTLHWVSASEGIRTEVRLFDKLFLKENPADVAEGETFLSNLNPDSLTILSDCIVEPSLKNASAGIPYQFLRTGYFCLDEKLSKPGKPVFNRSVSLRDSWAKLEKKLAGS
ncbi:MAG: glutamine--tRNA ligase, partial [Acidobacteria bacterium]|nr:glutamine--tRNA ligase [Acidobacteriota bacterium]